MRMFGKIIGLAVLVVGAISIWAMVPKAPVHKGTVTLFLSTDCPISARSAPEIEKMIESYGPKGFTFKACFSNAMETRSGVDQFLEDYKLKIPYCVDLGGEIAKKENVLHVPTAVISDGNGKKVYQGAILDNRDPSFAGKNYVGDILIKLDKGQPVAFTNTPTFGCILMPGDASPKKESVTYAQHVAPILNKHCVECHRPGEVAPFSLIGYDNAKKWAPNISYYTEKGVMPPWKAVQGFGEFRNPNTLSELEIQTLKRWADNGAKRGDPSKEPKSPEFSSEWSAGRPDRILSAKAPYRVEAEGKDEYRHFVIDPGNKETMYVRGMAVKPGNPKVVHHVIAFLDEGNKSKRLLDQVKDGKEGYATGGGGLGFFPDGSLGGWAPGSRTEVAPEGIAFEVKPGTKIVVQVHYHKNGKTEMDQTRVGLYLAKTVPTKIMALGWLANPFFKIPAGASAHKVKFDFPIPTDVTAYGAMPHMHVLGRQMKAEIVKPDGSKTPMIWIKDWDFNWQMTYLFKDAMKIPKGSKVHVEAVYDNSDKNPYQPHKPPKDITWGEETTDEMFLLVVPYTVDNARSVRQSRMGFGGGR